MITLIPILIVIGVLLTIHALPARTFLRAHRLDPKAGWDVFALSALEVPINTVAVAALIFATEGSPFAIAPLIIAAVLLIVRGIRRQQIELLFVSLPRILTALLSIRLLVGLSNNDSISTGLAAVTFGLTVMSAIYLWRHDLKNRKWARPTSGEKQAEQPSVHDW